MRVYVSGPMTGLPDFNRAAFNEAATWLRGQGFDVFNPAEQLGGDLTGPRADYMRTNIFQLLACDSLLLLPGWEQSEGATLEVAIARELGLPRYKLGDHEKPLDVRRPHVGQAHDPDTPGA